MRIGAIDGFEIGLKRGRIVEQLLPEIHRAVRNVIAGEGLAVVPAHILAQLEGDGLAVFRGRPAGRQNRHVALISAVDQRFHDAAGDLIDAGGGAQRRVKHTLLGVHMDDDSAAALHFFGVRRRRRKRKRR